MLFSAMYVVSLSRGVKQSHGLTVLFYFILFIWMFSDAVLGESHWICVGIVFATLSACFAHCRQLPVWQICLAVWMLACLTPVASLYAYHPRAGSLEHRSRIRYLSEKKFANFNEFSEIKKIHKNSYKNSLNARVGVAFQWNSTVYLFALLATSQQQQLKNLMRFAVSC